MIYLFDIIYYDELVYVNLMENQEIYVIIYERNNNEYTLNLIQME